MTAPAERPRHLRLVYSAPTPAEVAKAEAEERALEAAVIARWQGDEDDALRAAGADVRPVEVVPMVLDFDEDDDADSGVPA